MDEENETKNFMKKTSLSLLLILIFNLTKGQSDEPYYKNFLSQDYSIHIEPNDLLGNRIGLKSNQTGNVILKPEYDDIVSINEKYVRVIKDNKWGIVDTFGNVVIPITHTRCSDMDQDRIFLTNSAKKIALATLTGQLLTKYAYDDFQYFKDGLATVSANNLYGFINKQGVVVIPIKYSEVGEQRKGKIMVKEKTYTSKTVGTVRNPNQPYSERANEMTYATTKHYIIDYSGKILFTSSDEIANFYNGYVMTFAPSTACKTPAGWYNIELYDQDLKKVISYKACWSALVVESNFLIIKNGTSGKIGIAKFDGKDITKTPYVRLEDKVIYDSKKNKYIKLYKQDESYVYVDMDGDCVDFEGASQCE